MEAIISVAFMHQRLSLSVLGLIGRQTSDIERERERPDGVMRRDNTTHHSCTHTHTPELVIMPSVLIRRSSRYVAAADNFSPLFWSSIEVP